MCSNIYSNLYRKFLNIHFTLVFFSFNIQKNSKQNITVNSIKVIIYIYRERVRGKRGYIHL